MKRPTLLVGLLTALTASTLLGAIYIPTSRAIGQRTNRVRAASCLKSIGLAMQMYANAPAPAPPASPAVRPGDEAALWSLLRAGGNVVFMRHAATPPGSGEPANFDLRDPTTQRNLSDAGREQARRVGSAVSREGVPVRRVLCSEYFRCRETAALAFGTAEARPALDALPEDVAMAGEQVGRMRALAAEKPAAGNTFLVTHQSNVLAVTGIRPEPGEWVIVRPEEGGRFRVMGRLKAADAAGSH